jgi:hypothetical protein
MKQISFVIIIILLSVILFSIFKYASNEPIFENMSQGRFMIVKSIVDDDSPTTSDLEKVKMLNKLDISDEKIKDILDSNNTNERKILRIKAVIQNVTL